MNQRQRAAARRQAQTEITESDDVEAQTPDQETTDASRVRFAPSIKWFIGDPARETRLRK
jgi:hypothetical protein